MNKDTSDTATAPTHLSLVEETNPLILNVDSGVTLPTDYLSTPIEGIQLATHGYFYTLPRVLAEDMPHYDILAPFHALIRKRTHPLFAETMVTVPTYSLVNSIYSADFTFCIEDLGSRYGSSENGLLLINATVYAHFKLCLDLGVVEAQPSVEDKDGPVVVLVMPTQ